MIICHLMFQRLCEIRSETYRTVVAPLAAISAKALSISEGLSPNSPTQYEFALNGYLSVFVGT